MSKLKDLEPGKSHIIEEKNYRTGEVTSRTTYTKDKITGKIHRETVDYPNDPIKGKVIAKFRNSRLRDLVVTFLFLGSIIPLVLGYFGDSLAKWNRLLMVSAVVFMLTAFVLYMIGLVQMEIYARKLKKEMPPVKKEKIDWKKKVGVSLPVFISMIVVVFTLVAIVVYLSYMDMIHFE